MSSTPTLRISTLVDLGAGAQLNDFLRQIEENTRKTAQAFEEMGNRAQEGTRKASHGASEAKGSLALLGEEIGVKIPRHIRGFITELPGVESLLTKAFSAFAIIGLIDVLKEVPGKIIDATDAIAGYGEKAKKAAEENLKLNESFAQLSKEAGKAALLRNTEGLTGSQKEIKTAHDLVEYQKSLTDEIVKTQKEISTTETQVRGFFTNLGTARFKDAFGTSEEEARIERLTKRVNELNLERQKIGAIEIPDIQARGTEESRRETVSEGTERINAQKRFADAEIKLAEETGIAKAKAIASAEKLATLEAGLARTRDLTEQSAYAAQILDLSTKSADAVRSAQLEASNKRNAGEVNADKQLIALHVTDSEEDKRARQKALEDIKLSEITHQEEVLKITEEYASRIAAAKQKAALTESKIAEEKRIRAIALQEEEVKSQEIAIAGQVKATQDSYARQAKDIEESFKLRKVTYQQELLELTETYKQEEAASVALLEKKRALIIQEAQLNAAKNGEILSDEQLKLLPGMQEIDNQILAAHEQFLNRKAQLDNQALEREKQQAQTLTNSLKSAYDTMVLHATSFHDAVTKLWEKMGQRLTDVAFKMVGDWITAIGQGQDFSALAALKQITQSAYQAAANTYAAVSGTPIIGPVLAPVAAAAAFVAVEAFGAGVGSAEQGAVLPSDMFILAHQNEMILPAPISKAVQGLAKSSTEIGSGGNGGSAVHVHLNVQALDSTGVHQVLQNNLSEIGKAVTDAHKSGHISQHALAR